LLQRRTSMKPSTAVVAPLLLSVLVLSAYILIDTETGQAVSGFGIVCVFTVERTPTEVEETPNVIDTAQESTIESEELLRLRKKILKAVLAPAILAQLAKRNVLSATKIIKVLQKSCNIKLSPGTVYPVLDALEKDEKIKRLPRRINRLYVLTSKGRETIENIQENAENLTKLITGILKDS
jgi:DNA-binding PadR family transcriptional regulator